MEKRKIPCLEQRERVAPPRKTTDRLWRALQDDGTGTRRGTTRHERARRERERGPRRKDGGRGAKCPRRKDGGRGAKCPHTASRITGGRASVVRKAKGRGKREGSRRAETTRGRRGGRRNRVSFSHHGGWKTCGERSGAGRARIARPNPEQGRRGGATPGSAVCGEWRFGGA